MKIFWPLFYFASTGVAWYLGVRSRTEEDQPRKEKVPKDYLIGLNFLLNEETDKAVDVFVKMLEVDSDTVETHLAVGKLFRQRGEVDRAIRIHQNLIARPQLEKIYREQSLFELGQDYLSAGMLDRAEKIFMELVNANSRAPQALRTLIDIYQQEKAWEKAIEAALKYESITRMTMQPIIAHYYCELGETAFNKKMLENAEDYLEKALACDKQSVRASLLLAKVHMAQENYKSALKILKKIKDQNPNYLAESIELLALCFEKTNQEEEMITYLKKLADQYPRIPIVLILADRIRAWKGDKTAANFVADYVRRYPTLSGLSLFINLYISSVEGQAQEDLYVLQKLMTKVLQDKHDYQCLSCGFSGKSLHWHCPGCKQWNTSVPVHSLEYA